MCGSTFEAYVHPAGHTTSLDIDEENMQMGEITLL